MTKSKKLPKYVTYTMLAQFAKAADQTFAVKLAAMEERLRDEFGASAIVAKMDAPEEIKVLEEILALEDDIATYEGNELAPKAGE